MPTSSIRYAILKAVSSAAQAGEDKVSLLVQEQRCREAARARGWSETHVYSIPGESRTKYVNLSMAEAAMPDLKYMLDDARDRKFEVLVLYDYDRLRDLLGMVSKTLNHYRVQIFAVNMPIEPVAPSEFTPYKNDMAIMMETFAMMKQRAQTNDLRRKYSEAMPKRASQRGLPVQVPYGYQKPVNSKVPPEVDTERSQHVIAMKDMFLAGQSTTAIAAWMNSTGHPPRGKKWYPQTIKQILTNPFYAGKVRWGLSRSELDPRTGRVKRNRKTDTDHLAVGEGKHQPLWDQYTYDSLLVEFRRRGRTYAGKSNQALSGLLTCGICQQRLWAFYNNNQTGVKNLIWRCSSRQEHVVIRNPEAMQKLEQALIRDIGRFALDADAETESGAERQAQADLQDLKERRDRLTHAYTIGLLNIDEFSHQKSPLDENIHTLEHQVETYTRAKRDSIDRRIVIETIQENLQHLGPFLNSTPPADVNFVLRKIISEILVEESLEVLVTWK